MVKAGDVIDNPITGERMIFLQTGAETKGELLQIDLFVRPGGFNAAGPHVHPLQEERFLIKEGKMTVRIRGREQDYTRGGEAIIPPGTPHAWWNSGDRGLHAVLELRPSGRFDRFILSLFALGHAGKTDATGFPKSLLQAAVMLQEFSDVASPPLAVQKMLYLLAPVGRLFGYKAEYPYPTNGRLG